MPPESPEQPKLTGKQDRFVHACIGPARFNATQARVVADATPAVAS